MCITFVSVSTCIRVDFSIVTIVWYISSSFDHTKFNGELAHVRHDSKIKYVLHFFL